MKKHDQDEQVRRAKAALKKVEQETEKTLGGVQTPGEFDENDPIEIWGKRIGRGIGYVLVVFLLWHLATTYFIK